MMKIYGYSNGKWYLQKYEMQQYSRFYIKASLSKIVDEVAEVKSFMDSKWQRQRYLKYFLWNRRKIETVTRYFQ